MAGLNWPGLLAWSTKYHDGTAPSNFKVMSDEDRKFLERAMEEAFGQIEDPNKVLQECVGQIKAEDRTDESIMTALEVIDRLCDDPDVARNIEKLDGLQPLLDLTQSKGGALRLRTLEILALLFSNNPNIQEAGFKRGALSGFLTLTREAPTGSDDRSKAFRALVALVRQMEEFENQLLRDNNGVQLLEALLDPAEDVRTREKAASFVLSVASNGRLQAEDVSRLVAAVVPLLPRQSEGGLQYREVISACTLELARITPSHSPSAKSLADAVQARLAERSKGTREEGDDGAEEAALQECLKALTAAASA